MNDFMCKNCETEHDSQEYADECCACEHCAELESQLSEAREYVNSIDSNTEWIFDVKDCLQAILK